MRQQVRFDFATTMPATNLLSMNSIQAAQVPQKRRGTYFVQTWGCQMNEEDSEQIELCLDGIGFERTSLMLEAHVILLNTCSVRKKPEDKAFSMLGELESVRKRRPDVIIGVCGCMAQLRADEIRRRAPHVDFVVGTGQISQIPALVEEAATKRRFQKRVELPERKGSVVSDVPSRFVGRTPKLKAFVPIQYGCDKFCSFCIVPSTRGRERSRPTREIIDEITALCAQGTREVTLLGQTVNSYGKNLVEGRVPFGKLLDQISEISGLERIRYISPYPRDFRSDLIDVIRDNPKVMEHCHMPLQSGDDAMLREMKRLYTVESFTKIVEELRQKVPGVSLTTDVIVGFPGETDEQFENTLDTMRRLRFDGAYMFAYSIRPGTPAGDRKDQVPEATKKERLTRLMAMQNDLTAEINAAALGNEVEVLIEGRSPKNPETLQGYTRQFKVINFVANADRIGRVARARITATHAWGFVGELI